MVLDSDTTFMDGTESTVSTNKPRQKKKKFNSPYKTKSGLPKQFDPDKRREQWLKDLRSGNGRTMSGRAITGTTGTGGASTSRSGKSTTSAVGSARSVKVTVNTDADDAAFLSTSKYLQKKLLENHIGGGGGVTKGAVSKSSSAYGPSSKDPADMADEIVELKRKLALVESTINQSKGRMRRLEEENSRKDKQIEQLLNPGASDDTRRSLAERGGGESSSVVNSLKNKNIKLELTLKEKENELRKLKEDVKTTRAEEMKICMEAFYQEIIRLRAAVHTGKKTTLGTDSSKQERDDFASNRKLKTLNANVLRLSELNKDLESENERLKRELDSVKDSLDRPESGELEDMSREQLIDTAYKLQQKLDRYDEVMADQLDEEQTKLPGKMKLEGSFAERFAALDRRESELLQEVEKNKSSLTRSRDERDEWRTKYEDIKKECEKLKESQHHEAMRMTSSMNKADFTSKAQRSIHDPNMSAIGSEDLQADSSSLAEERRRRQQQREEDEEWRKRGQQAIMGASTTTPNTSNRERERESTRGRGRKGSNASSPDISTSTKGSDQIDSAADRKSEKFDTTVQLQSILRAHMSRCQNKPVSTAGGTSRAKSTGAGGSVIGSRPSSSLGRGAGGSPGRGISDRKTTPDSDNESTARTMTARSGRLDPISDRSDEGGASSSASGWGDVLSPASSARKTSPVKSKFSEDLDSPIGSPKPKPRSKVMKELSSESDVNEAPKKGNSKLANDNSDTDTTTTPRPTKRSPLSDDENFFGF